MKHIRLVAMGSVLVAAAPAKEASPPPPIANYWMDVTTTSGMGAGMPEDDLLNEPGSRIEHDFTHDNGDDAPRSLNRNVPHRLNPPPLPPVTVVHFFSEM